MTHRRRNFLGKFLFRWFVSSLGLWVAAGVLGDNIDYQSRFRVIILAGLILALVNTLVKPIVVLISLPVLIITLGLFMIVINGLMVMLASYLYSDLHITNFWIAMLAGMIIGLVNYIVVAIVE